MIISQRKSKCASAPVLVVAMSSPDPTIDPARISPGPRFREMAAIPCGGSLISEFIETFNEDGEELRRTKKAIK